MSHPRDYQEFFAIYKNDIPMGFYLTQDRIRSMKKSQNKPSVFRSIVEWGTIDEMVLSEYDIYRIAMCSVPNDVGILQIASVNDIVLKKVKRLCFFHHGFAYIGCRDLTKQYKDSNDINQWRIRVGYSDVCFGA